MRAFGMTPVLPAFAGFVPEALAAKYPNASIARSANWCSFPADFCCVHLLDPLDPLFQQIGAQFIGVRKKSLTSHISTWTVEVDVHFNGPFVSLASLL